MSAECHECGNDLVYPEGTWPLGECPVCTLRARLAELERERDGLRGTTKDLRHALDEWYESTQEQLARAEAAEAALAEAEQRAHTTGQALGTTGRKLALAERALRNIINCLGPDHFGGELYGLIEEGGEALRIARAYFEGAGK